MMQPSLFRRYLALADSKPILFNMINASSLFALGDILQQRMDVNYLFFGKKSRNSPESGINYYQTLKTMAYACAVSPFIHIFYTRLLPKYIPTSDIPTTQQIIKKIATDYLILGAL
jgi:hypothetical protein